MSQPNKKKINWKCIETKCEGKHIDLEDESTWNEKKIIPVIDTHSIVRIAMLRT
jgi:hypothetical protein